MEMAVNHPHVKFVWIYLHLWSLSLSGQPHKTETKNLNLNHKTEPQNLNLNHKIQLHECHQWIWGLGPCGCLIWNCMQEQVHRRQCGCLILDCMQEQVERRQYRCLIWRQCGCLILNFMQKQLVRRQCGCFFSSVLQEQVDIRQSGCLLERMERQWTRWQWEELVTFSEKWKPTQPG